MNHPGSSPLPRRHIEMLTLFRELGPNTHLSAAEVYEQVRQRLPGVGLATVHRGLNRLAAAGELMRLDLPHKDAAVYELAIAPHAHLICSHCNTIKDVTYHLPAETLRTIELEFSAQISSTTISFHGACSSCATTCA